MLIDVETFLKLIDAFAKATGLPDTTIGSRMFNDGKGVTRLRNGCDIGARKLKDRFHWLSHNWPPEKPWPSDIPRPALASSRRRK